MRHSQADCSLRRSVLGRDEDEARGRRLAVGERSLPAGAHCTWGWNEPGTVRRGETGKGSSSEKPWLARSSSMREGPAS
jgi:hypothetical protein